MTGHTLFDDIPAAARPEPARYPKVPGHRKRATSKAAAEAMTAIVGTLRDRVLAQIKANPGTADEIAARMGATVLAIRPRTTELAKLALIVDSGMRRANASGKKAIVWAVRP